MHLLFGEAGGVSTHLSEQAEGGEQVVVAEELADLCQVYLLVFERLQVYYLRVLRAAKSVLVEEEFEDLVVLSEQDLDPIPVPGLLVVLQIYELHRLLLFLTRASRHRVPLGVHTLLYLGRRLVYHELLPFVLRAALVSDAQLYASLDYLVLGLLDVSVLLLLPALFLDLQLIIILK